MELSLIWIPVVLGAVVLLAVLGVVLLIRSLPRREGLSPEEREELAGAPMPPLQKRAWGSLLIGGSMSAAIAAMLINRGAAAYWEDDDLRLLVMAIFLGGLAAYVGVFLLPLLKQKSGKHLDERDRLVLSRAPNVQLAAVLIALAAWVTTLPKLYHDEGAVPVVYLYLMFGSVIIVSIIAQSVGILLGYWISRGGHGEG